MIRFGNDRAIKKGSTGEAMQDSIQPFGRRWQRVHLTKLDG